MTCVYIQPHGGVDRRSVASPDQKQAHHQIDKMWTRACVRLFCSVCHSGIKFMRAMRRAQTQKLVAVQCEKGAEGEGEGCGAWAARWLTVPRAGTAC